MKTNKKSAVLLTATDKLEKYLHHMQFFALMIAFPLLFIAGISYHPDHTHKMLQDAEKVIQHNG